MVLTNSPRIYLYQLSGASDYHLDIGVSLAAGKSIGTISFSTEGEIRVVRLPIVDDTSQPSPYIWTDDLTLVLSESITTIHVLATVDGTEQAKGEVKITQADERD